MMRMRSWIFGLIPSLAAFVVTIARFVVMSVADAGRAASLTLLFAVGGIGRRASALTSRVRSFVERALDHANYSAGRFDPGRSYG